MRKVLLGTTALAAAGLIAAPAMADDMMDGPVTVGVGGYTTGAIGFYSDGEDANDAGVDGKRGHDISYVYEIGISGSTTLDNGISVAVSGQIGRSGKGNDDSFDEIHTTLSGAFGALRLGRTESAAFNATCRIDN
ncbi:MAG: porin, partial [Gammaproteobacteria bacterium]|nr:porin [Gammaproteobacteria bacterium]